MSTLKIEPAIDGKFTWDQEHPDLHTRPSLACWAGNKAAPGSRSAVSQLDFFPNGRQSRGHLQTSVKQCSLIYGHQMVRLIFMP